MLQYEQNLAGRMIAVVSPSAVRWPVIEPGDGIAIASVDGATQGSFTRVDCGVFTRSGAEAGRS